MRQAAGENSYSSSGAKELDKRAAYLQALDAQRRSTTTNGTRLEESRQFEQRTLVSVEPSRALIYRRSTGVLRGVGRLFRAPKQCPFQHYGARGLACGRC